MQQVNSVERRRYAGRFLWIVLFGGLTIIWGMSLIGSAESSAQTDTKEPVYGVQTVIRKRYYLDQIPLAEIIVVDDGDVVKSEYRTQFYADHLGSVVAIVRSGQLTQETATASAGSEIVLQRRYLPFGGERLVLESNSGSNNDVELEGVQSLPGFAGHQTADHSGLIYMNGRYYLPEIRQFISADLQPNEPYQLAAANRYTYVGNNPLSWVDPDGFSGRRPPLWDKGGHRSSGNAKVDHLPSAPPVGARRNYTQYVPAENPALALASENYARNNRRFAAWLFLTSAGADAVYDSAAMVGCTVAAELGCMLNNSLAVAVPYLSGQMMSAAGDGLSVVARRLNLQGNRMMRWARPPRINHGDHMDFLLNHYDLDELHGIAFIYGLDPDEVIGPIATRQEYADALLNHAYINQQEDELIEAILMKIDSERHDDVKIYLRQRYEVLFDE